MSSLLYGITFSLLDFFKTQELVLALWPHVITLEQLLEIIPAGVVVVALVGTLSTYAFLLKWGVGTLC